jgi:hypothetical protein
MLTLRKHLKLASKSEKNHINQNAGLHGTTMNMNNHIGVQHYGATTSPLFLEKNMLAAEQSTPLFGRKEYIYLHTKFGYKVRIMLNHKCG